MTSVLDPAAGPEPLDDVLHGQAVRARELVPTRREEQLGTHATWDADDVAVVAPPSRPRQQMGLGGFVRSFGRSLDPRGIAGSTRALLIFALIAFVGGWDDSAFGIIFPELQADFTFDAAFLIASSLLIPTVVDLLCLPLGYVADRVKRVHMVRLGSILQNAASMMTGLANGLGMLLGSFALKGVSVAVPLPAQLSLQSDYFPARSRIRALSFIAGATVLGGIVGPLVAGAIAQAYGWRATLVVLGGLAVVASFGTFLLREPTRGYHDRIEAGASEEAALVEQPAASAKEAFRVARGSATIRRFWYAGLFGFPVLFAPGLGIALIVILLRFGELGVDPFYRGVIVAAAGVVAFLGLPYAGTVTNRLLQFNPGRVMIVVGASAILRAGSLVLIAMSPTVALAALAFLPTVLFGAIVDPAVNSLKTLVIPANMRGLGTQTSKPFEITGRFLITAYLVAGALVTAPFSPSTAQAALVGLALPTIVAGVILASASGSVGRDMRAARAASRADEEGRRAKEAGLTKLLVCRDLDVSYQGTQVLFGVDFDVEQGELVALLGTNGAGKSTLLRAISGVQPASSGAVFVDGHDVTHQPVHDNARAGVVMVPGGHAVFPTLTVAENLDVASWLYDDDAELASRRVAVLELFPVLARRSTELAGSLSGGEQQMLAIGSAFLMSPQLLMIDELSLGLAPAVVEELLDALRRIHAMGTTIIIVEQSVNVATAIAERAVFMEKGEIRYDGPTAELMSQPQLVRAVFMGGALGSPAPERNAVRPVTAEEARVLLDVRNVSVSFGGVHALTDVDLQVSSGEIVGIIGPNGAGKTTLFDVVSGFVRPDTGDVTLDDVTATSLGPDARAKLGLGRSFQAARLFPALTVRENIAVAMELRLKAKNPLLTAAWAPAVRADERRIARRVDALIEILSLQAFADKFVDELSTGSRRAVDIACIMAAQPALLLLDEPSSGLAQAETEELGPVLERVARETGCAMLVIEHDIGLVSSISDRLVAMELGRVIASGRPSQVLTDRRVLTSYLAATEDVLARSDLARAVLGEHPPST